MTWHIPTPLWSRFSTRRRQPLRFLYWSTSTEVFYSKLVQSTLRFSTGGRRPTSTSRKPQSEVDGRPWTSTVDIRLDWSFHHALFVTPLSLFIELYLIKLYGRLTCRVGVEYFAQLWCAVDASDLFLIVGRCLISIYWGMGIGHQLRIDKSNEIN